MTRRKNLARREPNGRPQRPQRELASPTEISRLRDAALAGLKDPIWGTQLGILHLSGKLSGAQLAAGRRWAELARDYSTATQSPRQPRSANLSPHGGTSPDPDSPQGVREVQRQTQTLHRYLGALEVLKHTSGAVRGAVMHVCEIGQYPSGLDELNNLKKGLDALCIFWSKGK